MVMYGCVILFNNNISLRNNVIPPMGLKAIPPLEVSFIYYPHVGNMEVNNMNELVFALGFYTVTSAWYILVI